MTARPGLCGTWSETSKTGFLTTRLKLLKHFVKNIEGLVLFIQLKILSSTAYKVSGRFVLRTRVII